MASDPVELRPRECMLPGQPLAAMFDKLAKRTPLELICELVGLQVRQVNRWRSGDQRVSLDEADRVLTELDRLWWEVWNEDTVREPLFVVHVFHHRSKAVRGVKKFRRLKVRSVPYGDLGTDYAELRRIGALFSGTLKAAA